MKEAGIFHPRKVRRAFWKSDELQYFIHVLIGIMYAGFAGAKGGQRVPHHLPYSPALTT